MKQIFFFSAILFCTIWAIPLKDGPKTAGQETEDPETETIEPTGETIEPTEDKQQCLSELLEWCQKKELPSCSGLSVVHSGYDADNHEVQTLCLIDLEGVECMRDNSAWFHCFPNRTIVYEGKLLSSKNSDSVDDFICEAKELALVGSSASFDDGAFDRQLKQFYRGLDLKGDKYRQMLQTQKGMFSESSPFANGEFGIYSFPISAPKVIEYDY